ncbi:amidohydrolase, partial [Escherichia coli]|nr:amidohydrolase [Escherichia coli]
PNCDVLVANGKIKDVGPNLQPPLQVEVVDCKNQYLFPGFIDVHTHLGLYDEGTGWAGNDANETIEPLTPHIRALDSVHPLDSAFKDAVQHGITT